MLALSQEMEWPVLKWVRLTILHPRFGWKNNIAVLRIFGLWDVFCIKWLLFNILSKGKIS